ncbi:UDP-D-apiose/UDP-D-xylose synthase 2-like [Aristolochia californica]|uniref:UDP-D-apiose/UDP-D-xylose synthase 2-like n=1 Tax=Aristolochia californica TaxID=171875 RepID=UPI0035D793CE
MDPTSVRRSSPNHKILAVDVYNDKIKHLLEPAGLPWADRIQFHRVNIRHDSRLEGLIKMADLIINLAAICTPADYNARPLDTIYSNFIDALPVVYTLDFQNLLRSNPLKLVDGGQTQNTFVYVKDAIEAVLLMIENPARANGHIFNVGNPNNEVTVKQTCSVDVSSKEFYGEGYDDSNKRIPDMTIINKQLASSKYSSRVRSSLMASSPFTQGGGGRSNADTTGRAVGAVSIGL